MEHEFQLLALDIDGTVLDSEGRVCPELKAELERLRDRNVRTVLSTGRRWRSTLPVLEELEHACPYVVCCGGALIKQLDGHHTLYSNPVDAETVRRAADIYRDCGLVPIFLFDLPLDQPELFVAEQDREYAEEVYYLEVNRGAIRYFDGSVPEREACLEVYTVDHRSKVLPAMERIGKRVGEGGVSRAMIQPRYGGSELALEVHAPDATKWTALQWLMDRWEVPAEEVLAVGDDVNDVPMLEAAGLSFAMGNASDQVKAAADSVTTSNDNHGVAEALRQVFGKPAARKEQ